MKRISKPLLFMLFVALTLRIFVMFWSFQYRENTDVLRYRDWGRIAYLYSFADTYKPDHLSFGTLHNNQPPGSLYIISTMYYLQLQSAKVILAVTKSAEGSLQFINGPLLNGFLRFPALIADLFIGFLIFKLVRDFSKNQHKALFASAIFLFNPLVLYNSAFWGQMDSLNNLFFLLGLFFLVKKKHLFSVVSVFLSLFVKLSLIFLLPFYVFILLRSHTSWKKILFMTMVAFLFIMLLTFPISSSSFAWLVQFIKYSGGGEIQNITAFAFNFWWVIFKPGIEIGDPKTLFSFSEINLTGSPSSSSIFLGIPLSIWAVILFAVFILPLFYQARRLKDTSGKFFLFFALAALIGFLFLPRMHERYLYPLFPLMAIYIGLHGKFLWTYVFLTTLNVINVYLVWHPMMLPFFPYDVMNNQTFQWIISILTLGVGISFYIRGLKTLHT